MESHLKKKKEYERKLAKYKPLQEAYLKEKTIYDEWFKVHVKEREKSILENEVRLLKVQLTKLEKQKSKLEKNK